VTDDVIQVHDHYYILATSSRADDRTRVIKHGDTFAIFDHFGDIVPFGLGEQGLYHDGTRHLSRLDLRLNGTRPLLLSSSVREDNDVVVVDLTNPDIPIAADRVFPRDILHLFRSKFLWNGTCYEQLRLTNHGLEPVSVTLAVRFEADFVDIFEVRGTTRPRRGRRLEPTREGDCLVLAYEGLDAVRRRTVVEFTPAPAALVQSEAVFPVTLDPQASRTLCYTVRCESRAGEARRAGSYEEALAATRRALMATREQRPGVETGNEQFNDWLGRSMADLQMMISETSHGPYPYAGVPWFSTPFGRDGIITALELLWVDPNVARGVLSYLAATQATEVNAEQDAEPGKILHETRGGEMAALGEIPFGRYYGSVDATPLFVILAGAHYTRTDDREFLERIWPNIEAALDWIDRYGDPDGDGFIDYIRQTPSGLAQQGWKDSQDSVFHADGPLAQPPIALCEVQAYVHLAWLRAAELSTVRGDADRARALTAKAEALFVRFNETFWDEALGTYVLAIDAAKAPCRVRGSNAGHCLFGRIATPARAAATARALTEADMFSGWGVRTVSSTAARYNPMSYHNGSVWPHDNAIVANGCAEYGLTHAAMAIFRGMFDLSLFVEQHRLPELICGFLRRPGEGPTLYPVACAPQAWAAGALFLLLQSTLGLSVDAPRQRVIFNRAMLPDFLPWVRVTGLRVGKATIDLRLERHRHDVGIEVLRRSGPIDVVAVK
jgi:glycogen debranching enzyme